MPLLRSPPLAVVLSTCPSGDAERIARSIIDSRAAACVNVIQGVASVYRWLGAIETGDEALLVIKCPHAKLDELAELIETIHPYEVPEIVAFDVAAVHDAYGSWVDGECQPEKPR